MTDNPQAKTRALPLLRNAVNTLVTHKVIFFPFLVIAFVQLLVLEILYFAPRPPLNAFFGPLISRLWSEKLLHYPYNFAILTKLFQTLQIPIFIFISSFFICVAVATIAAINSGHTIHMKRIIRQTFGLYVHIVLVAILSYLAVIGLFKLYSLAFNRALLIRSQTGMFYWLKMTVIKGAPYFQLLLSVLVTTLLAYAFPIIVIEKNKFFTALLKNFKILWGSFWTTLFVVLIPSLFYLIVLYLRKGVPWEAHMPEVRVLTIILSILIVIIIDAIVYTALTIRYLLKKEHS